MMLVSYSRHMNKYSFAEILDYLGIISFNIITQSFMRLIRVWLRKERNNENYDFNNVYTVLQCCRKIGEMSISVADRQEDD